MGDKKLLLEYLNRFNSITEYNPSKGLIKEDEQLGIEFPIEYTNNEQEVISDIDSVIEYMKDNVRDYNEHGDLSDDGIFHQRDIANIERKHRKIKSQLSGDTPKGHKGYPQQQVDKDGRQQRLPIHRGEINTTEDLLNLLDFITTELGNLNIDNYEFKQLTRSVEIRIDNNEKLGWIGNDEEGICPECDVEMYDGDRDGMYICPECDNSYDDEGNRIPTNIRDTY